MEVMPGETLEPTGSELPPLLPPTPQLVNGHPPLPLLTIPTPLPTCGEGENGGKGETPEGTLKCNGEVTGGGEELKGVGVAQTSRTKDLLFLSGEFEGTEVTGTNRTTDLLTFPVESEGAGVTKTNRKSDLSNFTEFQDVDETDKSEDPSNIEARNMNVVLPPLWMGEQRPPQECLVNGAMGETGDFVVEEEGRVEAEEDRGQEVEGHAAGGSEGTRPVEEWSERGNDEGVIQRGGNEGCVSGGDMERGSESERHEEGERDDGISKDGGQGADGAQGAGGHSATSDNQTSFSASGRRLFTLGESEEAEDDELFNPERDWPSSATAPSQQPDLQELYQPKCEPNPFHFDLSGAIVNIENESSVHFGPKSVYEIPSRPSPPTPDVSVTQGDGATQRVGSDLGKDNTLNSGNNIHINIHTPPVAPMTPQAYPLTPQFTLHSPASHTMSDPVFTTSPAPTPVPRPGPRPASQLPQQQQQQQQQQPQPHLARGMNTLGMPPTPTGSGISLGSGARMVFGTQIVINHPPCSKDHQASVENHPTPLENLLTEVREKLSTVYIRQTRTSFLPWLKGHQVIPMTDFYTNSRILAVDKQGRQTRTSVNLVRDLMEEDETQYLVEGEPGMGKTLLALKLAIDWANKESLQKFKFVFLIFLRDFKGSLETYVKEELLPSHFEEKFRQVWKYCKENEDEVLFILDGYDELERDYEGDIKKLLHKHQDFQNSKVVVTARPGVLKTIAQRTVVKGFSEEQMFEFITKYFKLVNEDENGRNLNRIIEKDDKYKKLAKRPLFCVLLCMLYGADGVSKAKLPQKLSDMMFKIMLCLIKWNIKKGGNVDENTEDFPPMYEELFLSFGKLCLQALKTEKTRFSKKEIESIENYKLLLHLGFLSNDSDNDVLGPKKFWKPVHKIFLEYLAGLYMASHIEQDRRDCRECREFSKVYRHEHVLKFVVGILGKRAHLALDGRKHQELLQMKDQELLMLLRETELTRENCRAVAKLLDRRNAIIYTSEVDFEGWSYILAQNFKRLKTLEIVWRIKSNNPDQESSFNEASPQLYSDFFNALRSNTSITKISIRATQDGEPFSDKKIELFFTHLQRILNKENLRELEIKELKMRVSEHLRKAIEGATCNMDKKALEALEILRLDMYLRDEDLGVVCDRLRRCATNLKELQLTGLEHGHTGFKSLVELLKKSKNLHKLCLSMNKESLTKVFMTKENLTPSDMHTGHIQMPRHATQRSKDAFRRQEPEQRSQRVSPLQDPTRELSYLFHDHLHTGVRHSPKLRCFYFISGGGETRLPLPLCVSNQHHSVFHTLFSALPESCIKSLTLDYPCLYLSTLDLVCLGDAIRRARHLTTLKLLELKTAESYMPVLLGLGQSQSLKTVKLESHHVVITDTAFQLACKALRHNTALRTLSLAHWEFNLQDKALATQYLHDLLSSWKVVELNLSNCTIDVSGGLSTAPTLLPPIIPPIPAPVQHWPNIKTLRLSEVKVKDTPGFLCRGHLLLPVLRSFPNLTNLDLSASHSQPTTLDDNAARMFFKLLGTNFKKLQELTLGNWEFKFEHYEQTCVQIGNMVRSCSDLKVLVLDKVSEVRSGPSLLTPCRITFLHQLVNNLPRLAELSLCYYRIGRDELSRDMASCLGACFHDHWSSPAKFKLKFFRLSADVEAALHEALKKENVDVVVSQGYPLIFTVRRGYFLRT